MKKWEVFEDESIDFLKKKFSEKNVTFKNVGKRNSNKPDIKVYFKNSLIFNIEAKFSPSQAGQFVVLIENNEFIYSPRNKFRNNEFSKEILKYINSNFDKFRDTQQTSIEIECNAEILANWVKDHYIEKNSLFIITSDCLGGYKAVVPIEEINKYFTITACARRKKSGTRHLPLKDYSITEEVINATLLDNESYEYYREGKKTYLELNCDEDLNKEDCYIGENLFLSKESEQKYAVKRLNTTNNINVVFSMEYTGKKETFIDKSFFEYFS